ncbi:GNAT family N-acetyltransferase [Arthrobacter sp. ISL-65]|uniref:GNAT family N-acetyltransferase n=1 Tax=Arthrobacter sp. ISL-65 TaxID=2819112 RepID=UPI001BE591B0|nr:GNAT family N-acetyltransferase [Arthrobacter sp. ISL-65]MBT2550529.1 N-acetyltransferase [Arthrobacter sp. ISL-65]
MENQATITVRNTPERHRYEILDGDAIIGKAHYLPHDGNKGRERIFYHTTVSEDYAGQGLAARLVQEALDDTLAAGIAVVPVCPYVKVWLRKHPDYQPLMTPVHPEHLTAVENAAR